MPNQYNQYTPEQRIAKFWSRVDKPATEDACWNWLTQPHITYPSVRWFNNTQELVHRASWELHTGEPPGKFFVCHHCDNPRCVRPSHLFLGTVQDNVDDMHAKNRQQQVYGEAHYLHKVTEVDVVTIRARYACGTVTQQALADEYGISIGTLNFIIRRKTWKHVP